MDPRTQKSLMEAAINVVKPKEQINESTNDQINESTNDTDTLAQIAETYINAIIGNQLNESTEKEQTELIADLVEHTNLVCHAINTYFDLY